MLIPLLRQWRDTLQVLAHSLAHFLFQILSDFFAHGPHNTFRGLFFIFWLFIIIAASSTRQGVLFVFVGSFSNVHVLLEARRMCVLQQATHGRRSISVELVCRRKLLKLFQNVFHFALPRFSPPSVTRVSALLRSPTAGAATATSNVPPLRIPATARSGKKCSSNPPGMRTGTACGLRVRSACASALLSPNATPYAR